MPRVGLVLGSSKQAGVLARCDLSARLKKKLPSSKGVYLSNQIGSVSIRIGTSVPRYSWRQCLEAHSRLIAR